MIYSLLSKPQWLSGILLGIVLLISRLGIAQPQPSYIPQFYAFKDTHRLKSTHPQLYDASQAVIKLLDATAAFVCANNQTYLMTNHHVLGAHNCAKNGCYAKAQFNFAKKTVSRTQLLHLTPVAGSADADIAFYSFQPTLNPVKCLKLAPSHPGSAAVTLIGHPRGSLKKYSQGKIIEHWGGFIHVSAFSLPGSSGSPIVNQRGQLVGIHHSSAKRNDMFTKREIIYHGRGSSLNTIKQVLATANTTQGLNGYQAVHNPVDFAQAKARAKLYQQARISPQLTTQSTSFFNQLAWDCEQVLNKFTLSTQATRQTYRTSIQSCKLAKAWIGCPRDLRLHTTRRIQPYQHCPPSHQARQRWQKLFAKVAQGFQLYHGDDEFVWHLKSHTLSTGTLLSPWLQRITRPLQQPRNSVKLRTLSQLSQVLNHSSLRLPQLTTHRLVQAVKKYHQIPGYTWHLSLIAQATYNLYESTLLTKPGFDHIMQRLMSEPRSTLNTILLVEKLKHEAYRLHNSPQHDRVLPTSIVHQKTTIAHK